MNNEQRTLLQARIGEHLHEGPLPNLHIQKAARYTEMLALEVAHKLPQSPTPSWGLTSLGQDQYVYFLVPGEITSTLYRVVHSTALSTSSRLVYTSDASRLVVLIPTDQAQYVSTIFNSNIGFSPET